jgi:hypothetical protein
MHLQVVSIIGSLAAKGISLLQGGIGGVVDIVFQAGGKVELTHGGRSSGLEIRSGGIRSGSGKLSLSITLLAAAVLQRGSGDDGSLVVGQAAAFFGGSIVFACLLAFGGSFHSFSGYGGSGGQ